MCGSASGRRSVPKPVRRQSAATSPPAKQLVDRGKRGLALAAAGVGRSADTLGPAFARAVEILNDAKGRVIVSGLGKSGLIARKIAATFTSTGTPATFLHPVDSLHGDLGIVSRDDVAIVLSKSGASDELFGLISHLKRLGVPIGALTGDADSPLGRQATVVLDASVAEEACPETLAPTASTTVALGLGDARAVPRRRAPRDAARSQEIPARRLRRAAPGRRAGSQALVARLRRDAVAGSAAPHIRPPHARRRRAARGETRHGSGGGQARHPDGCRDRG